jgi:hypothetical protein
VRPKRDEDLRNRANSVSRRKILQNN